MKNDYLQLKKFMNNIKGHYNKVKNESFAQQEWSNEGQKINSDITNFENYFSKLSKSVSQIKDNALERNYEDIINQIDEALEKGEDTKSQIRAIREKTSNYTNNFENNSNEGMGVNQVEGQVMAIMNEQDVLDKRRKELENIHSTAALLKDTTDKMAVDVNKQGAVLEEIEANVIESKNNAEKGKKEIMKADEISRGNRKRFFCLLCIILVALGGIAAIILSLVL